MPLTVSLTLKYGSTVAEVLAVFVTNPSMLAYPAEVPLARLANWLTDLVMLSSQPSQPWCAAST